MADTKEMYEFKKTISFLKKQRGEGTELISVLIKPGANVNEVVNRLRDEYGQAGNIKSKQTRKNVLAAIDKILSILKGLNKSPEHGLAVYAGSLKGNLESFTIQPHLDINVSIYRCDSTFFTEPLEDMAEQQDSYGLMVLDRREATFAILKGKKTRIIKHLNSTVPGKHGKGGQSAMRFTRLIEQAVHEFFVEIGETANLAFADKGIKGIVIGGPGPTKFLFINGGFLFNNVQQKVLGNVDTSYTDEFGIREVEEKSGEFIKEMEVNEEKELVDEFIKEAVTDGLATYGYNEVKKALQDGKVNKLLVSEDLEEKIIEELTGLAEQMGSIIEMVSVDTAEGQQFKVGFTGIGAMLRYR